VDGTWFKFKAVVKEGNIETVKWLDKSGYIFHIYLTPHTHVASWVSMAGRGTFI